MTHPEFAEGYRNLFKVSWDNITMILSEDIAAAKKAAKG